MDFKTILWNLADLRRYLALENYLKRKVELRVVPKNTKQIYDTLIITVKNKYLRKKIVKLLNYEKFGTKNLPDAIKWHCAYFWKHALPKAQINRIKKTKNILEKSIAIPIWLKKTPKDYKNLGKKISKYF